VLIENSYATHFLDVNRIKELKEPPKPVERAEQ
jgi:hypothetical protein